MKHALLSSAAALLLFAGTTIAFAQDRGPGAGAAPAPSMRGAGDIKGGSEMKGGSDLRGSPQGGTSTQAPAGTTGQAPGRDAAPASKAPGDSRPAGQTQDKAAPKATTGDNKSDPQPSTRSDTQSDRGATTGQGAAGTSASLTQEQRTKISTTIKRTNVKPVTNVNFNVTVGAVVPRTVELHPLPATVIEVYPQWRGYRFVLVSDEIIIIEPSSYKIVAVIAV
ncbi:MAG: hypothetical protein GHHEDOFH_00460 [Pseudorhodoplanes sp.]|nr:hypothetical protein [Pseudorhodoplanes sp.]